jgi:hypothetical protein
MLKMDIEHCNNISECELIIQKESLNIYYAMNGTGKSTIGKALELLSRNESLDSLKPFAGNVTPVGTLSESRRLRSPGSGRLSPLAPGSRPRRISTPRDMRREMYHATNVSNNDEHTITQ